MISDSTLQRTLAAVNSFGELTYLVNLASFVLYLDIMLSVIFRVSLVTLTFDWVRMHVTVGGAVIFLLSYVFIKSTFLPQVQAIFYIVFGIQVDLWYNRTVSRAGRRVSETDWLEYSILTRNTPAYRELEARRKDVDEAKEAAKSSFCLVAFIVSDLLLGVTSGETIGSQLINLIARLPRGAAWICTVSLGLFLLGILISGLLVPSFTDIWVPVRGKALRAEIQRVLAEQPEKSQAEAPCQRSIP